MLDIKPQKERSLMKPDIRIIQDKNGNNKRKIIQGQMQNPEPIKFMYLTAAYDSYIKEGFTPPLEYERPDFKERDFLSSCNTEYGPVKVKILAMVRQKAVDWAKKSHERKSI